MPTITKEALEASLKKFLLKKPLDKITINDLTERDFYILKLISHCV